MIKSQCFKHIKGRIIIRFSFGTSKISLIKHRVPTHVHKKYACTQKLNLKKLQQSNKSGKVEK